MTTERKTTADHLAEAMQSNDLSAGHDVDYLTALGMAGIHSRRASSIFRLVNSLDRASYHDALSETIKLMRRLNARHNWRIKPHLQDGIAKQALDFFICPTCPACKGRRYELIPGTPTLSPIACRHCRGSGVSLPPKAHREAIQTIAGELTRGVDVIVGNVRARMFGERL